MTGNGLVLPAGLRVLVFRVGSIGDMVVAVPALRAFCRATSPSRVVLLTDEQSALSGMGGPALLAAGGLVHDVFTQRGLRAPGALLRLAKRIRHERFGAVLYLAPGERSTPAIRRDRLFFRACGVPRILGANKQRLPQSRFRERPLARVRHEADELLGGLRAEGIPCAPLSIGDFDLGLHPQEKVAAREALARLGAGHGPFIGVATGTKHPSKQWPLEHFEYVLRRTSLEVGLTPVFVGGAGDRDSAHRLIGRLGVGINACGELSVRESAALLQQCRLFLGNDSGPMHLAYATRTPCVVVFSARDLPGRWEPFGVPSRVFRTEIECAGCQLARCPRDNECLRAIDPERVFDACRELNPVGHP